MCGMGARSAEDGGEPAFRQNYYGQNDGSFFCCYLFAGLTHLGMQDIMI